MEKIFNNRYKADEGKYFVLTEKETYQPTKNISVGEPVAEGYDSTIAAERFVENGYLTENPIPDWIESTGYEVVYDRKENTIHVGNPVIFPAREIAEKYLTHAEKDCSWIKEKLYIRECIYRGPKLKECRQYNGKKVYSESWYYGPDALEVGDLVEEKIVDEAMNMLPPACMRGDCSQVGEPANHMYDNDNGKIRPVYTTFKRVAEDTWEYCGSCFRGENVQRGKKLSYV